MATPTSLVRPVEAVVLTLVMADSTFVTRCPGGIASVRLVGQTYPFTLMTGREKPWNTFGGRTEGNGREVFLICHVYSRYKGDHEAWLIAERLTELLDGTALTITGYNAHCEFLDSKLLIETDRDKLETRHIPAEFLVRVHE